jgi:hypothetical protein
VEPGWGPPNSPGNDLCRSLFEHGGGAWLAEAGDRIRLKVGRFNYVSDNPPWYLVLTDTISRRVRPPPAQSIRLPIGSDVSEGCLNRRHGRGSRDMRARRDSLGASAVSRGQAERNVLRLWRRDGVAVRCQDWSAAHTSPSDLDAGHRILVNSNLFSVHWRPYWPSRAFAP